MAGQSVLVVEDSEMMRQLIVHALSRVGELDVVEAGNGLLGMRQLAERKFDLIITDINMPIMDGLKVIKRARADEHHRYVPILVISTEGASEDRERALSLGATDYITKPIRADVVVAKVKQLLTLA